MQALHKNKDEKCLSRGADLVDVIIYTKKVGRYLEEECFGELRKQKFGICDSRKVSDKSKKDFSNGDNEIIKMAELNRKSE